MSIRHLLNLFLWKARKKKALGFSVVCLVLVISMLGNAVTYYFFDNQFHGKTVTFMDSLWYSVISISTIGYGDNFAESTGARLGTVVFIVVIGLAAFTAFFGVVLDWFIDLYNRERKGMCRVYEKNHILIINFPSVRRVSQVIEELIQDQEQKKKSIVIITDTIDELPFTYPNVSFVHGSPIEEETYEKANIMDAREAIILRTSSKDPNSDSVVASIISIIEHLHPKLYTVAECINEKHRRLFESSRCDSIVCTTRIVNNLLAHESQDRGVISLVDVITSHGKGETIYTLNVGALKGKSSGYVDFAKLLLDQAINLLCINRENQTFTDFTGIEVQSRDQLVYISKKRVAWSDLEELLPGSLM